MKIFKRAIILVLIIFISASPFSQTNGSKGYISDMKPINYEFKIDSIEYIVHHVEDVFVYFRTKNCEYLMDNFIVDGQSPRVQKSKRKRVMDIFIEVMSSKGKKLTDTMIMIDVITDYKGKIVDVAVGFGAECDDYSKRSDKVCFTIEDYIVFRNRILKEVDFAPINEYTEYEKLYYCYTVSTSTSRIGW